MHAWAIKALSTGSPYTALSSDHVLLVTTGASDYTINLPTAVGIKGKPYKIKKVDSGAGTVIIDANGTETIDGALTFVLSHQNDFVDLVSDDTNWKIVSTNTNLDWDNVWSDAVHDHSSNAEGGVLSYSGHIIQVVNYQTGDVSSGSTSIPYDDTIPQNTEGDQYMSLAITPSNVSNKLLIQVLCNGSAAQLLIAALFQDTTSDALAAGAVYSNNYMAQVVLNYLMTAGTTSSTTFKVRMGGSTGGATLNGLSGSRKFGGVSISGIKIMEIAA
jgi:hypothetical protein